MAATPDPYLFRVTVVMPAWPLRFSNMHFRAYLERFIRQRMPAHIYTKICWLDPEQMGRFREKYGIWKMALIEQSPGLADARNALIATLKGLHNVYPPITLHDNYEDDFENPAVLDNAMLGSFAEGDGNEH